LGLKKMREKTNNLSKTASDSNKNILKFIFLVFVLWQSAILLITFISPSILPLREQFTYSDGSKPINPRFLWNRANFDGSHYLNIVKNGFGLHEQSFFPFYPELIKFLSPVFKGKDLLAGLFISNFSLLIFLFVFYKLIIIDYDDKTAKRTIIFLLIFPASFFLTMVYSESLFLMLLLGCFYAGRKGKWLIAGILGGLASYTRIVGVFIFPALIYEWYLQHQGFSFKKSFISLLPLFFIPLGLLKYTAFLNEKYHDPLIFIHAQSAFVAGGTNGRIILIYQVFWRYLKMILETRFYYSYFPVWLELLTASFFAVLLILAYVKKVRFSYLIFSAFSYFIPTLSGTFLSLPRFALTLFPCFIFLGMLKNVFLRRFLLVIFSLLFIVSTAFFLRGYWIS